MDSFLTSMAFICLDNNCYQNIEYGITLILNPFYISVDDLDEDLINKTLKSYLSNLSEPTKSAGDKLNSEDEKFLMNKIYYIVEWIKDTKDDIAGFKREPEYISTESKNNDSDDDKIDIKELLPFTDVDGAPLIFDKNRKITILTWGNRCSNKPQGLDYNYNAACIQRGNKKSGISLRKNDGRNEDIQRGVCRGENFTGLMISMIKSVEKHNYSTIGINCHHGKHRSVTCAELLKKYYWLNASVHHIERSVIPDKYKITRQLTKKYN
jgi:hypothetical protein